MTTKTIPAANHSTGLSHEDLLSLYRAMVQIRRCEEQLARSHQRGLIHGACHTYVGQEAIAAGVCADLRTDDVVFSTHRGHGHALAKGVSPRQLFAELFGRATGCSQGRGGSMHLFAPETGMMGTSGIVGPCILQATGAGYSFTLLKTDQVAVAFFGDGAVNNGAFHEGLNMASIWKLPVLFVCENNQFATEVPFAYAAGNPSVASRGASYGMPGVDVDGNDVIAVYKAAAQAVTRARAGDGPTLLECRTYRTRPHAEGMGDYTYRTRDEVEAWKTRCPILRLKSAINHEFNGLASHFDAVDSEIDTTVADAVQFAEQSPWPDPATATQFVFAAAKTRSIESSSPAGAKTTTREITSMQATLEGLSEEMARDPSIFVLGEGIGVRGGNFKTTAGLFDLYGPLRLRDTPISERGFVGRRLRRRHDGYSSRHRFHVCRFSSRFRGRDNQSNREDAVHEQRAAQDAHLTERLHRNRPFGGHASLWQLLSDVRPLPGPARRGTVNPLRCQGIVETFSPLERPGDLPRTP